MIGADRLFDRLQKLLRLAASPANVHEASLAATRIHTMLDQHDLPVRYIIPVGTAVRVVPLALAQTASARAATRDYTSQRVNVFTETHRVKGQTSEKTLAKGYFLFDRYGYLIFVPVRAIQVAL